MRTLKNVENGKNLDYSVLEKTCEFFSNRDNCCTCVNKVLIDSEIDVSFNKLIKTTGKLIKYYEVYAEKNDNFPNNFIIHPLNTEQARIINPTQNENNIDQNSQQNNNNNSSAPSVFPIFQNSFEEKKETTKIFNSKFIEIRRFCE